MKKINKISPKATFTSEEDTILRGARVDANELEVTVGRNLVMQSVQRYTSDESEYGVSSKPYLLGKITPSVAGLLLKKEEVQSVELMQTRVFEEMLKEEKV